MPFIEGCKLYYGDGNIVTSGVNEVQTMTISAASGSTFALSLGYEVTAAITWSSDNATLIGAVEDALGLLQAVGSSGAITSTTSAALTSGVGTFLITFSGDRIAGMPVSTLVPTSVSLTGASATVTVAKTTTGVVGSFRGAAVGALAVFSTGSASAVYINTGGAGNPTWTLVGSQQ
jgi:hypothetical protein